MDYSSYSTAPPVHRGGGVYTHRQPDQSIESKQFIKELIRESQLAHVHRNFIETILENGTALPPLKSGAQSRRRGAKVVRPTTGRGGKRTQENIRNSGAYNVEPFVPKCSKANVEKEKARLQSLMTYGKACDHPEALTKPKPAPKPRKEPALPSLEDRFQIVLAEIQERSSFLNEMADLGQAEQYRAKIQAEISERVRELESLSGQMKTKLSLNDQCIEEFKQMLPR